MLYVTPAPSLPSKEKYGRRSMPGSATSARAGSPSVTGMAAPMPSMQKYAGVVSPMVLVLVPMRSKSISVTLPSGERSSHCQVSRQYRSASRSAVKSASGKSMVPVALCPRKPVARSTKRSSLTNGPLIPSPWATASLTQAEFVTQAPGTTSPSGAWDTPIGAAPLCVVA